MSNKKESPHKKFGERLHALRESAGIGTQAELAQLLGVRQQKVSRWEAGASRPRSEDLPKLAAGLKVDAIALSQAAGYAPEVVSVSFYQLLPLAGLTAEGFEYFSLDFLATHFRNEGVEVAVHPAGKTGHKQHGIDIEAVFEDGSLNTFQCKREREFGPGKVRDAIKAQTSPAKNKYILLSRVASPDARKAIKRARGWDIWDQVDITRIFRTLPKAEQIRIVDIFFPTQRFALTGETAAGPWLTVEDFFAPHLANGRIFNHRWTLVGRGAELDLLAAAFADANVVSVSLIGRAGEGKSRVLRSALAAFTTSYPQVLVRVASQSDEITAKSLEDLGTGEKLIVIDDAHDGIDLGQVIRYAANERNNARLLLVYRPYWTDVVQREQARFSITGKLAASVVLTKPTKQDAVTLGSQVLTEHGAPSHTAAALAELAYDSPLAVVVGAQIIAKEGVHPELFGSNEEFRSIVLKRYEQVIAEDIAEGKDRERVHSMLRVLALIQPMVPDDRHVLELLSSVEGIHAPNASRLARLLIDAGVLFKRGSQYRLSPDLLADSIIETACITSGGQSNGYAERLFAAAIGEYKEHVLINLGRLEWRRNDGDTSASRLLDGLWNELVWDDDYQQTQVKAATSAAYYQPRQALAFARRLIDQGHGKSENVCGMIRNAAFTLNFLPDACALLWEAGCDDTRATNSHPSHPIRLLTELATPEPRKPVEFIEQVVEYSLSLLDEPESWTGVYTPFDVLRGALATEGHFTSASSSREITISQYAVQRERVEEVRQQIIAELFESLSHANRRRAFIAAQTIGDALRGPMSARSGKDDSWGDEFAETLDRLDAHIESTTISAPVLVRIAESVHWHAFYGPERTRAVAQRIIARLDRDIETRTVRALIDAWGTNTRLIEVSSSPAKHEADADTLCRELTARFADPIELACFLNARLSEIEQATGNADFGPAQLFVGRLLMTNRELASHLVQVSLDGDASYLTAHVGRALGALLTGERDEGLRIVGQLVTVADSHLVLLAEGYMFATHPTVYTETDVEALYCIFSSENQLVLRCASHITLEVARRDKVLAIDLLSVANIDLAMRSGGDFFMWLAHEETIPFALIRDDQLRRLIDGLRSTPRLDDHWVNAFLKKAIQRAPGAVLGLAKARIDASIESDDWSIQPLGSVLRGSDALDLLALPDGVTQLRDLLEWALGRIGDYKFSYRFAEMLQLLCSPYDATCVATIEDWLIAGGTADHFKVVTAIVRDAGDGFIFDNERFIARSLGAARAVGRKVFKDLSSAIFATSVSGLRSGSPGQPFEADVRLKDLAEQRLARITRTDPTHDLYADIKRHATQDIERQLADGRRMDEEDADA
jgi:transcriptional regulator with XRE-family HTH domain